ncbi:hypothetical protein [Sporosarcina sp. FSL K6-3508]|uniref:hypothetical protein n=1 Tax=Sporosarcina sp. FSL K6-3508 TaxID=2921557 RepID=UPI003159D6B9
MAREWCGSNGVWFGPDQDWCGASGVWFGSEQDWFGHDNVSLPTSCASKRPVSYVDTGLF